MTVSDGSSFILKGFIYTFIFIFILIREFVLFSFIKCDCLFGIMTTMVALIMLPFIFRIVTSLVL